jgi:glyoxylase-like metal-dependent hydrolase (beta-lactamase superfamily II)
MKTWTVGKVEVTRIVEVNGHTDPLSFLLEGGSPELMKKYDWLFPDFATPEGDMRISFQCFVLKAGKHRIMIDTCIGNDRRRRYDIFNNMQTSFLADLALAGCPPESINTVLCTHLHFDHVGWNTRRVDGEWVPTFPNARYLFGKAEWDHWKDMPRDEGIEAEHLVDSIDPVIAAGLADFVDSSHKVIPGVSLVPTPGHTPGHVSVHIASEGKEAVITGDLMHHPVQIAVPDMKGNFCMDPAQAGRTRRAFVERHANRQTLIIGSHFCDPTAGRIVSDGEGWKFRTG